MTLTDAFDRRIALGATGQLRTITDAGVLGARFGLRAPVVDEELLEAGLSRIFPGDGYAEQRDAARAAARQWTTVLTGGPGTGKTTTVAGVLTLVAEQHAHE